MSQFIQWWHENPERAEAIRAGRRQKLRNDPSLAEAHRARCRAYYARTKRPSSQTRGANKPKIFWAGGVPETYWSAGQTAAFLAVSPGTLRSWEARGVLPPEAKIVDGLHRRWWLAEFVQRINSLVLEHRERRAPLATLRSKVHTLWRTLQETIHERRAEVPSDNDQGNPDGQAVG